LDLALGPGHASITEENFGLPFERLTQHASEYFQILRQVFNGRHENFEGETFHVDWELDVASPSVSLLLSSLGEQMCRTARRHADGVLPWLAPPALAGFS